MMVTTVHGKFHQVEGELELDELDPTRSRGDIRAAAASLSTGVEMRDNHLRSADFLDAEHYPWVVARTTAIERTDDRYRVQAELTIRDETRPVTFDAEFLGFYPSMQGGRRVGFHLDAKLMRTDWGLNWNMALEAGGWPRPARSSSAGSSVAAGLMPNGVPRSRRRLPRLGQGC
jgi:polyisoprenoid-binding protein YceI